jgi:hypothetical protein
MASAAFYPIAGYSARMSRRSFAVTGVLLLALLVPAAAEAAVIQPLKPCYVTANTPAGPQQEGVAISASGFTPNSTVDLAIDGALVGQGLQTDATGSLNLAASQVKAPFIPKGTREFTVTLTETGNPANTASATALTTALGVSLKPERARPDRTIRFKGSGFVDDKPVYAHYVYKNKLRKTVRMARKTTDCGGWTSHRDQIPVSEPDTGNWIVQFDQSKRYRNARNPNSGLRSVFVLIRISVTRVLED